MGLASRPTVWVLKGYIEPSTIHKKGIPTRFWDIINEQTSIPPSATQFPLLRRQVSMNEFLFEPLDLAYL